MTPLRAIYRKCKECCSNTPKLVRSCSEVDCPLFLYRLGHNPARKGIGGGLRNLCKKTPTQVDGFREKEAVKELLT